MRYLKDGTKVYSYIWAMMSWTERFKYLKEKETNSPLHRKP